MERSCKTLYTSNNNQAPTVIDDDRSSMQLSGEKKKRIRQLHGASEISQEHAHQQAFMNGKEVFKHTKSFSAMLILDIIQKSSAA